MSYRLKFKNSALKDVRHFPQTVIDRINIVTHKLTQHPRPHQAKKLKGFSHTYRYRFGQYRIIYHIDSKAKVITVLKIGHRKDIYR